MSTDAQDHPQPPEVEAVWSQHAEPTKATDAAGCSTPAILRGPENRSAMAAPMTRMY